MTTSPDRRTGRRYTATDVILVLGLLGTVTLGASIAIPGVSQPREDWPAEALAAVSCLAQLRARTYPRSALVVATVATVITVALGYLVTPLILAPLMIALFRLAAGTDTRTTRVWGALTIAVVVATAVFDMDTYETGMILLRTLGPVLWLMLPLVGGSRDRLRRAHTESVQARAAYAERTREEEARLRVAEERLRIARELHDVVAHHMAVANAQAGTARHLAPTHPEQAMKLLDELTATTSSALLELRATVGVLRQIGDDLGDDSLEPAPGLDRLPELIATCESAGVEVTVVTEGEPRPLSPGVDLTAYRIIQEALTNVTKHGAGTGASVRLTYSDSRVLISVTNDAATTSSVPGGGYGLMGMRERAHSIGGDLHAGPRPGGGFEVATALPLHPLAPDENEAIL
ncbi:sensor histidine kinase [Streptomyces sp. NPDC087859]|uniref:sensor histidine kinase n=1 Tax=Streptomyces sp. NPDC087859 TaxID=3365812 RepID=UPI0038269630